MPPVVTEDPAAAELVQAYADAWTDIEQRQRALIDDPRAATKRARLREMQAEIGRQMSVLNEETDDYVSRVFPEQYAAAHAAGFEAAGQNLGEYVFRQTDRQAAEIIARGLQRDLIAANLQVVESTRTLVRKVGTDAALRSVLQGDTAKQASREMRRILENDGIHAVTYANGRRVGLKGYAEMVVRSQTAIAYNQATVMGAETAGVAAYEVFDGPSCGWQYHDSPDQANGRIVTASAAAEYPISHPNCRRAFGPRPDLGLMDAQGGGDPKNRSATDGQTEAQVEQDDAKGMPTRREIAQRQANIAAGKKGSPREIPRADAARVRAAIRRPDRVLERTDAAARRLDAAKARATPPAPAPAKAAVKPKPPTPKPDADKVYPQYIFELGKIDDRLKASTKSIKGHVGAPRQRMRDRLATSHLDPATSSEHDLLVWMQEQSAKEGFGHNLQVAMTALDSTAMDHTNRQRVIRYLVDGGKYPTPPDLKVGTKATDVIQGYAKRDATHFPDLDTPEKIDAWNRAWDGVELTPAQSKTIRDYSRGTDGAINRALRKGAGDGPRVNALRASMRPMPQSVRVRRGLDADGLGYEMPVNPINGAPLSDPAGRQAFLKGLEGQTIEDRAFLSTSTHPTGAFSGDVEMIIDVPEGYRGAWVEPYSSTPGEMELLLDRRTRLEITKVELQGTDYERTSTRGNYARVYARVVHQDDVFDWGARPKVD